MTTCLEDEDPFKELLSITEKYFAPQIASKYTIYRVPKSIREIKEAAYTPQLISIGPLHHDKPELADMEKQKKRYTKCFLSRITMEKREKILNFIKTHEDDIRGFYAETIKLNSLDFVRMILYDAIFIIELFYRNFRCFTEDLFLAIPAVEISLHLDLQLLENQLPFTVLDELYSLAFDILGYPTFMDLSVSFFGNYGSFNIPDQLVGVKHFTDLIRAAILKNYPQKMTLNGSIKDLPCAVKLHESGVKFTHSEGEELLDIRFPEPKQRIPFFKGRELQIPNLTLYDMTECVLRNVMALEQCHYPSQAWVCNYVALMDFLIDTEKDVDLLVGKGIISNYLGDNASVKNMFNKLCLKIVFSESCYYDLSVELKDHYKNNWNKAKAALKSVYFSNPWRGTATIAAVILLLLTVIQTICSIIQVV